MRKSPWRVITWEEFPLTLTTKDMAVILNVSKESARKYCESGVLPAKKIGKVWRISKDKLRDFVEGMA